MVAGPGKGLEGGRILKVEWPGFSDDAHGALWSPEGD